MQRDNFDERGAAECGLRLRRDETVDELLATILKTGATQFIIDKSNGFVAMRWPTQYEKLRSVLEELDYTLCHLAVY